MRLLVLGGTAWLGGHLARTALERGHQVTCLARGTGERVPDGATFVRADRDEPDAYDRVIEDGWDAVIDVARQPGHVRRAVAALEPRSLFFAFVSSGNVYVDQSTPGQDESAAVRAPLDGDVMESMETYGEAKVACEQHVLAAFGPDRSAVLRVGLIGGPGDVFGRTGYWPLRFARPSNPVGAVLVPDVPELPTQVIDVRDLAGWIVRIAEQGTAGTFNATGTTTSFADHLSAARAVAGHRGPLIPASEHWLAEHHVQAWMGERSLPIWLTAEDRGLNSRDNSAARAAGLTLRPLELTLADTLAWEQARPADTVRRAGLTDAEERELLHQLQVG